jgi:hypothetical protein
MKSEGRKRRHRRPAKQETGDHEALVSSYFEQYGDQDRHFLIFAMLRPAETPAASLGIYQLPSHRALLSGSADGQMIRRNLGPRWLSRWSPIHEARSILTLPEDPASYSQGASKQTLRRKVRAAEKQGVHWAEVHDGAERERLLALAEAQHRDHPLVRYRESEPDIDDLPTYQHWLAAYASDGRPLLLSVTPIDGEWALLRYFRTLGAGPEESNARYLMTQVLVEQLVACGVRYLMDASYPVGLPNGLRHFQRMLGFRIARVRLASEQPRAERTMNPA